MGPAMEPATDTLRTQDASAPQPTAAPPVVAKGTGAGSVVPAHAQSTQSAEGTPATASVAPPAATAAAPPAASTSKVAFPVRAATTTGSKAPPAVGHTAADAGSIGGAVFSLLLVVGLILALAWLARRMPGMQRGAGSTQLKVVASVALGARERAVVVDVGGTQLLLGVGSGGVRTLHRLEQPLPAAESGAPSPFAQVLAQHFGKKS
jgi:flagellar protein FliO/FliZ